MSPAALTLDRFLGGRIIAAQPAGGFRAGHDTVLLAAAVPAESGSTVLELGCGAGIASLCLAARVPGVRVVGIDIDPDLVRLANENAVRNGVSARVSFLVADAGDFTPTPPHLLSWPAKAGHPGDEGLRFDHVFFNPPFHPDSSHVSPIAARDRATRDTADAVRAWTENGLSLVRERGTVTAIVRADRVDDVLDAAHSRAGIVFPLFPRAGTAPKRTIVRILKGAPVAQDSSIESDLPLGGSGRGARVVTATGLILHEAGGRNTNAAEAVLRHAHPLNLAP